MGDSPSVYRLTLDLTVAQSLTLRTNLNLRESAIVENMAQLETCADVFEDGGAHLRDYWQRQLRELQAVTELVRDADDAAPRVDLEGLLPASSHRCDAVAGDEFSWQGMTVHNACDDGERLFGRCLRFAGHSPDLPHDYEYVHPDAGFRPKGREWSRHEDVDEVDPRCPDVTTSPAGNELRCGLFVGHSADHDYDYDDRPQHLGDVLAHYFERCDYRESDDADAARCTSVIGHDGRHTFGDMSEEDHS